MSADGVLQIRPGRTLRGSVVPPGDKSISHRVILLAALAQGESRIENLLVAGVTRPMLRALMALGIPWQLHGTTLQVHSKGPLSWHAPTEVLDCGHSATTMRLLAGALAAAGIPAVLDGSPGLRRRPMRRVTEPLQRMGVPIYDTAGHAPLRLEARSTQQPLRGGVFRLPVASAQVKSAILLAGLAAAEPLTVQEPGPSRDHTERLFQGLGLTLERLPQHTVRLHPPRKPLPPLRLRLPGDLSAAAFLIVAALITPGSELQVQGVGLNPTRTGLLAVLRRMGAAVEVFPRGEAYGEPYGDLLVRYSPDLRGTTVAGSEVVRMIDEFPALAVAAAYAQGPTIVRDAEELRHKESDRIAALAAGLRALGVHVDEHPAGFTVHGRGRIPGGTAHAAGDHRLAMALAVAGLAAEGPVTVIDAGMFRESYPNFVQDLERLGAQVTFIPAGAEAAS